MIKEGDRLIKEASSKADGKLGGRCREGGEGGKWREGGAGGRWRVWKEAISRRCKVALARTDYSTRLRKLQKNWVAANHPIAGQPVQASMPPGWERASKSTNLLAAWRVVGATGRCQGSVCMGRGEEERILL